MSRRVGVLSLSAVLSLYVPVHAVAQEADAGWHSADLGSPSQPGSTVVADRTITIVPPHSAASGEANGRWAYQRARGEFEVRCRVDSAETGGLVLSESERQDTRYVRFLVTSTGLRVERRESPTGQPRHQAPRRRRPPS